VLFSFSFFDLTRDEAAVRSERSCQQIARAWRASSCTTVCESIFVTQRLRAQAYGGHTVVVWSKRDRNVLKVVKVQHQFRSQVLRDNIQGITKPAIRRLARRGGVRCFSDRIYKDTLVVLTRFLDNVMSDALELIEGRRLYITAKDVVYVLKRQGITLYGFGA
jgi:histone H4